jgi:hypothetical protein
MFMELCMVKHGVNMTWKNSIFDSLGRPINT